MFPWDNQVNRSGCFFLLWQGVTRVKPYICTMPLKMDEGWNQIQFNLADFTRRAYGTNYVETLRVQVHANCRLRRIYFSDRLYSEEELPPEFKLYLPTQVKMIGSVSSWIILSKHIYAAVYVSQLSSLLCLHCRSRDGVPLHGRRGLRLNDVILSDTNTSYVRQIMMELLVMVELFRKIGTDLLWNEQKVE